MKSSITYNVGLHLIVLVYFIISFCDDSDILDSTLLLL